MSDQQSSDNRHKLITGECIEDMPLKDLCVALVRSLKYHDAANDGSVWAGQSYRIRADMENIVSEISKRMSDGIVA